MCVFLICNVTNPSDIWKWESSTDTHSKCENTVVTDYAHPLFKLVIVKIIQCSEYNAFRQMLQQSAFHKNK